MINSYPVVSIVIGENEETNIKLLKTMKVKFIDKYIEIPSGFTCDGASIPRVLWRIFGHPLEGKYLPAAIAHDYCYKTATLSRQDSDFMFYCLLRHSNICFIKRSLMYIGVRLCGWRHYD